MVCLVFSTGASPVSEVAYLLDADGQRVGRREVRVDPSSGASITNTSRILIGANPTTGVAQRWAELTDGDLHLLLWGRKPIAHLNWPSSGAMTTDYLIGDALSSVRSTLSSPAPGWSDTAPFDAFGNRITATITDSSPERPGYGGEFFDVATGLYDLRARAYDPHSGRFTSQDPFEGEPSTPVSRHRYLYAHGDPINHLDPSGLVVMHAARDLDGMPWGTHQFLILVPDHPEDFVGAGSGAALLREMGIAFRWIGGKWAVTAGGHSVGGRLTVQWLERADELAAVELLDRTRSVPLYRSDFDVEAHDISPPAGLGDTEFILRLLKAMQHYRSHQAVAPIEYPPFGGGLSPWSRRQWNSNSWVSSLLEAVGGHPWPNFSGYDPLRRNRIPNHYFQSDPAAQHPAARENWLAPLTPGLPFSPLPFP
ncbi:MAG: hypothetical protein JNN07_22565 [Verrucomicrobiales bacterium]|nr:hypothetical protein [Verrucomicrobiales bacterium]